MRTILRHGAGRGEVRPGAVVPVAVAPMRLMGFFLLREEPVTDRTLTEIAGQVMLPLVRAPPEAGRPGVPELKIIISPTMTRTTWEGTRLQTHSR